MDKSSLVPVVGWRTHFSGPSKLILKFTTSRLLLYLSFVNNFFMCHVKNVIVTNSYNIAFLWPLAFWSLLSPVLTNGGHPDLLGD